MTRGYQRVKSSRIVTLARSSVLSCDIFGSVFIVSSNRLDALLANSLPCERKTRFHVDLRQREAVRGRRRELITVARHLGTLIRDLSPPPSGYEEAFKGLIRRVSRIPPPSPPRANEDGRSRASAQGRENGTWSAPTVPRKKLVWIYAPTGHGAARIVKNHGWRGQRRRRVNKDVNRREGRKSEAHLFLI